MNRLTVMIKKYHDYRRCERLVKTYGEQLACNCFSTINNRYARRRLNKK